MRTKEEIVKSFNELYSNSEYVFVVDCKGVNAEDTSRFRSDLNTKCGVKFFVCKNTLNKIATNGTKYEGNIDFNGQCGVIFCNENENKAYEGKKHIDGDGDADGMQRHQRTEKDCGGIGPARDGARTVGEQG